MPAPAPGAVRGATPVLSYAPVTLRVPGRPAGLILRVTAPAAGTDLPLILLSHGHGGSLRLSPEDGYAPIAHRWAADGFVVVQPTHLSSRRLGHLWKTTAGAPLSWRSRAEDMTHILDRLDEIEKAVPLLAGVSTATPPPGTPWAVRRPSSCWAPGSPTPTPGSR